jgi:hypothetical protein
MHGENGADSIRWQLHVLAASVIRHGDGTGIFGEALDGVVFVLKNATR